MNARTDLDDPSLTQWLAQFDGPDPAAGQRLFEALYDELRRMARSHLRHENQGHTLSATANARLVCTLGNEALAACSTQAVPKPSANGRGTGNPWALNLASSVYSAMARLDSTPSNQKRSRTTLPTMPPR